MRAEREIMICLAGLSAHIDSLVEPLTTASSGHQYFDVQGGLASQVLFSINEYPETLRR